MQNTKLKVSEIFYSIEGEGKRQGELCVFVRLYGCNLACGYCDTDYAKNGDDFVLMSIAEILDKTKAYQSKNLTLTGGEPLWHDNVKMLIKAFADEGYDVNVETNGSIDISKFIYDRVFFTCDYKCPSSKFEDKMFLPNLTALTKNDVLKFVVADYTDLEAAHTIIQKYSPKAFIYFSPVSGKIQPSEIVEFLKQKSLVYRTKLQLQLHKYIYADSKKGV